MQIILVVPFDVEVVQFSDVANVRVCIIPANTEPMLL